MKLLNSICVFVSLVLILSTCNVFALQPQSEPMHRPVLFEPNIGLETASVKFIARGTRYKTLLASDEVQIEFKNEDGTHAILKLNLEGSQPSPVLKQVGPSRSRTNYFMGSDPSKWKTDVPAYGSAIYKDVYSGIDWRFYEQEGLLEFDFIVAAGSDPSKIAMNLDGVDKISIQPSGDLILQLQSNEFRMLAPVVYQCDAYKIDACEGRTEIKAKYEFEADRKIQFTIESYDPTKTLIIDPKISFGTMLGGNTFDNASDVAVDPKGNFYVVGYTEANTRIPGNGDGFVHKFSPTGALIWSTFLVGSSGEGAGSIAVNPAGICFVGGSTSSRDFPIAGAFQPNFGGSSDGFIVKLAANGTIMKSSFIGGSGRDAVIGVKLGKGSKMTNGLYLFGNTDSRNFPRKNATQTQFGGGRQDGFVAIVHSIQFQQVLSTYVGRNGTDQITSLALNTQRGDLYVMALSLDNSEGSYILHLKPKSGDGGSGRPAELVGKYDIAKYLVLASIFTQDIKLLKYALLLILESSVGLETEKLETNSAAPSIVLTSVCPRQSANTPCFENASLTFFDPDLNRLRSMNFGGTGPGVFSINDVVAGTNGALYLVGETLIKNLPVVNAVQAQHKGGYEAIVLSLSPGTFQPAFYSYLGGPAFDFAAAVAVDNAGNIFVAGQTSSKKFPTTPGAPKRSVTGTADGYVIKITP